jgi:hypothetical protein
MVSIMSSNQREGCMVWRARQALGGNELHVMARGPRLQPRVIPCDLVHNKRRTPTVPEARLP